MHRQDTFIVYEVFLMLVKPRTPTKFRPLQSGVQQLINEDRAKKASSKRIISMSGVGNERYGRKRDK